MMKSRLGILGPDHKAGWWLLSLIKVRFKDFSELWIFKRGTFPMTLQLLSLSDFWRIDKSIYVTFQYTIRGKTWNAIKTTERFSYPCNPDENKNSFLQKQLSKIKRYYDSIGNRKTEDKKAIKITLQKKVDKVIQGWIEQITSRELYIPSIDDKLELATDASGDGIVGY